MSYIINSSDPFVSIKLTDKGREQLSRGQLTFSFWAIGDSEINYDREEIVNNNSSDISLSATSKILRPFDKQPNIKSFIMPSTSTSPFQPINTGNLNVIDAIVNNEATERGFFYHSGNTFSTLTSSTITPYYTQISNTTLTGGTSFSFSGSSGLTIGDLILLKLSNDKTGTIALTANTSPIPSLWYKIQNISGTTITVDRNLPNYSSFSTSNSSLISYRSGEIYNTIATGDTTAYWDSGTLSFNSAVNVTCHDVPVWNMNNVWCEDLAGMTGLTNPSPLYEDYKKFGSYSYLGTKNPYLEYLCSSTAETLNFNCNGPGFSYSDDTKKSISIIHYTNNSISNLYGEFLYIDTTKNKMVEIHMPDLMYHRRGFATGSGTTMGMTFVSSGTTQLLGTSDIEYVDLIEDSSLLSTANTTPLVVGRVFPQLKMIVIHDDEIVSAISYKSNRNWTLPSLSAVISSPSGGTSTGVLDINETIYLTYALENTKTTGLTTSLTCQEYVKLTNNSSSPKDIAFRISDTDLLPYMRKYENPSYDGLGFYADKFKLVYQIVQDPNSRPDAGSWKTYDFTSTAITSISGQTIDPKLLEIQVPTTLGFILDKIKNSGATTYDITKSLNMALNNSPSSLQFGDERFFYGNLETYIGATIYKTIFEFDVNSAFFNSTTNPTRSLDVNTNPPNIKVSEIGIYDLSNNLVSIGKLSTPVELKVGSTITFQLSMDF